MAADQVRMTRVLNAWAQHLVHPSLPRALAPVLRSVGFEGVEMQAHSFATAAFNPDAYGVAVIPLITSFVLGRNGISHDEAEEWAAEQQALGERGEFYFTCTQFCFTGVRPN